MTSRNHNFIPKAWEATRGKMSHFVTLACHICCRKIILATIYCHGTEGREVRKKFQLLWNSASSSVKYPVLANFEGPFKIYHYDFYFDIPAPAHSMHNQQKISNPVIHVFPICAGYICLCQQVCVASVCIRTDLNIPPSELQGFSN